MICAEREPMAGRDICGSCGSDAKRLGPEADTLLAEQPDYETEHLEAQRSGEVFEEEEYEY